MDVITPGEQLPSRRAHCRVLLSSTDREGHRVPPQAKARHENKLTGSKSLSKLAPLAGASPATKQRWLICAFLFVITTINYMDRNILGVLKPTIQGDLHFTETDFGNIIFFFSIAYALGYAGMGWLTDKIGIRLGLAAAAILWCLASTTHGMVSSV